MAGAFPDVPGNRIAWDRDRTQAWPMPPASGSVGPPLAQAQLVSLNDEDNAAGFVFAASSPYDKLFFLFPQKRDLKGIMISAEDQVAPATICSTKVDVSSDTTNGIDGTWTTVLALSTTRDVTGPNATKYRSIILALNAPGVRGIRVSITPQVATHPVNVFAVHLFGTVSFEGSHDRLEIWRWKSAGGDAVYWGRVPPAYLDFGDTPRRSSADIMLQVRNMSQTLTAHDVTISVEALTDTAPSVASQILFSYDPVGPGKDYPIFSAAINIGDIAPYFSSNFFAVRRVTPLAATLGPWCARIVAKAGSWS